MSQGRFITFEGGEGAGKSTQVGRLSGRLRAAGRDVVVTREPGGSGLAETIRGLLLVPRTMPMNPLSEALLFCAARADHLDTFIRPALAGSNWVLCDRFADSTRAYQGGAGGLSAEIIDALERIVVGGTSPDLTIMLDLPAATGLARARGRATPGAEATADAFESRELAYHERLRHAFLAIAAAHPERCVVVDATQSVDSVESEIWRHVTARLGV